MALQKQFKRKDLKKPDLLHVVTVRFFNYYEKSKWTFIAAVCGLIIFAGSVWAYQYNRQVHEKEMETLYFKMVKVFDPSRYDSLSSAHVAQSDGQRHQKPSVPGSSPGVSQFVSVVIHFAR